MIYDFDPIWEIPAMRAVDPALDDQEFPLDLFQVPWARVNDTADEFAGAGAIPADWVESPGNPGCDCIICKVRAWELLAAFENEER